MSVEHTSTAPAFLTILEEEFKKFKIPQDMRDILQTRYTDLNYSVRIAAVVRYTRDAGFPLNKDDFNHVVVGRLNTQEAIDFMDKKRQEAQPITKYDILSMAQDRPLEASITKGGLIFQPTPFKF